MPRLRRHGRNSMTDLHRLPAEREPAFWEAQRVARPPNAAPMALNGCCCETDDVITPRRIPWGIVITAIIGIGFSLALFGYANASEPPRTWQVWDETSNKPWLSKKGEPATATG